MPPAPFPRAAGPPRGAPDPGGETVLYSDMSTRYRRGKLNRNPGSELRRSGKESQETGGGKDSGEDTTVAGKEHSRSYFVMLFRTERFID